MKNKQNKPPKKRRTARTKPEATFMEAIRFSTRKLSNEWKKRIKREWRKLGPYYRLKAKICLIATVSIVGWYSII